MGRRAALFLLLLLGGHHRFFGTVKWVGAQPWPCNAVPEDKNPKYYKPYCRTSDPECCRGEYRDPAWCAELTKDDADAEKWGWTRPFTGFDQNGKALSRNAWVKICQKADWLFKMTTADFGAEFEHYSNRLRFQPNVVAQEGLSFCVIGKHFRQAPWSQWEPLKGFHPLAEKSFDIGNHIDPDDSRKMNRVQLPKEDKLRAIDQGGGNLYGPTHNGIYSGNPWHKDSTYDDSAGVRRATLPSHRFKYVWLGVHPVTSRKIEDVPIDWRFTNRPAHPEWQPDEGCQNPYRVQVSLIEADEGIILHNYLHITVKAEPVSQPSGKCPTGRIKYLMLEVRDQDGYPVGQFTDDVTCDEDEATRTSTLSCPSSAAPCKAYYATKKNIVPCMFSHPKAAVHPTIFMLALGESTSSTGTGGGAGSATPDDFCRNSQIPQSSRKPVNVKYKDNPNDYVTEVHTTWRFAQMDHAWVSELHFATLIVEDETPIQYYTSRMSTWMGLTNGNDQASLYCRCQSDICSAIQVFCCWWTENYATPSYKPGRIQLGLINSCVNETYNTNRPYGYSARYQVLKPTFRTRGGWDFFRSEHIQPPFVNCHVDITYGPQNYYQREDESNPEKLGVLPLRTSLDEYLRDKFTLQSSKYSAPTAHYRFRDRDPSEPGVGYITDYTNTYELPDWHNPGMSLSTDGSQRVTKYYALENSIHLAIWKMFDSAHQDPIVLKTEFDDQPYREYFGSRYCAPKFRKLQKADVRKLQGEHKLDQKLSMAEMGKEKRCPCPFVYTSPPPELQTKSPFEIEGRRTHVVNMLLAWVILVPVAFFVSRFYKETFSRVFFLQEFWWYTIHVLCLITALLFSLGGLYALHVKRQLGVPYEILWTDATAAHIYMGYTVLGLFAFHLLVGAYRCIDTDIRIIQIGLHWLFGWLEYLFAVGAILAAAAIPSGVMSCITFYIYCGFIVYQLAFQLGMEYHLRQVDQELQLDPPRAYLPPPMMRLFHRDAPHAQFRMAMLAVFTLGCLLFYVALHVSMKWEGGEQSCFQPTAEDFEHEAL